MFESCDTFVVLPPCTRGGCVVFGKNSDRPPGEVQEVVYMPPQTHPQGAKLKCTYISVDQVPSTRACILSKPAWMWGAEMGANDAGVCIGNEAVFTKTLRNEGGEGEKRLLGMDLLRLGLERGGSAREALDVITSLLELHGQGGPCTEGEGSPPLTYHNSFLMADPGGEAWLLETAGRQWAARRIRSGCFNVSNRLTIGTEMDLRSRGLEEHAREQGLWGGGELNFAEVYGEEEVEEGTLRRLTKGRELLEELSQSGDFGTTSMFQVLRDCESGICRGKEHKFPTAASQVSVLAPRDSSRSSCHWFTGTPDPAYSVFKPFVFCSTNRISRHIVSPTNKMNGEKVDRRHTLYLKHERAYDRLREGTIVLPELRSLESQCVRDMDAFLEEFGEEKAHEVEDLFKDVVESEMKFYNIK